MRHVSIYSLTILVIFSTSAYAQIPKKFQASTSEITSSNLLTNVINDIVVQGDTIWLATEQGVSYSRRGSLAWVNLANTGTFDSKGISAIGIYGNTICAATGYSTSLGDASVATGGGLHISTDHGMTWKYVSQPVDNGTVDTLWYGNNPIPALAITVPQQNITYDVAITSQAIWTANWAGMLRKSTDNGATWQRVILPPDDLDEIAPSMTLQFELSPVQKIYTVNGVKDTLRENNNHKLFAVYASNDSVLWVGTANGINKSTDGGISWKKFSHQNQSKPISGNFVVAITEQQWNGRSIIWAATNNAVDPDEVKGVSFSDDGGETWKTALHGFFVHNIAWRDSIVYVATSNGVYRSDDFGITWSKNGSIYDAESLQRFVDEEIYCVGAAGDTVFVGGIEGLAYTIDSPSNPFGSEWHIIQTCEQIGLEDRTYAYPNPFSPDFNVARIHYSTQKISATSNVEVSITLFNFAMQPVRTILHNASRNGGREYDEFWNGKDDRGNVVANGVYFYSVTLNNGDPIWGKIMVLR